MTFYDREWQSDHKMRVPDTHLPQKHETFSVKQDAILASLKLYTHSQ